MSLWESVLLGFVQGATEFLPVSSSGHLVVTQALLGLDIPGIAFEIVVHLATLVSICWVYRERLIELVGGVARRESVALRDAGLLILATIPAAVIGIALKDRIETLFDAPEVAGVCLILTGFLLWTAKRALDRNPEGKVDTARLALLIGVAQSFALLPGISRSGTTVVVALWLGIAGREAAAFSFLMAIPAIGGAAILSIPDLTTGSTIPALQLLAGGLAAAVTGILAINTFLAMLKRERFHLFAAYLIPLGVFFLGWLRWTG